MPPFLTTVAWRAYTSVVVLATGLVVARCFGSEARGALGMVVNLRLGLHAIASLGIASATTYYVARDPACLRRAAATSLGFALAVGVPVGLALAGAAILFPRWLSPFPTPWACAILATAPAILVAHLESGVFLGAGWLRAWNAVPVAHRTVALLGLAALAVPGLFSLSTVAAALVLAEVVNVAVALAVLRARGALSVSLDRPLLRTMSGYSRASLWNAAIAFALVRFDTLLLGTWAGTGEAGQYEAGILLRDVVLFLPWVAGLLIVPRVAGAPADRGALARALSRPVMAATAVVAAALWAFAPEVVSAAHGAGFARGGEVARILIPGAFLAGYANVWMQDLFGRGAPRAVVWVPACGFAVALAVNLVAIPRAGAIGSAWASSSASAVGFALAAWARSHHLRRLPVTPAGATS